MNEAELPKFQCHKVVHALKLAGLEIHGDGSATLAPEGNKFAPFRTQPDWASKISPKNYDDPGYYVVYEDGYTSWSPTKAFEDGYTLIED